jgi:hypothetical protein
MAKQLRKWRQNRRFRGRALRRSVRRPVEWRSRSTSPHGRRGVFLELGSRPVALDDVGLACPAHDGEVVAFAIDLERYRFRARIKHTSPKIAARWDRLPSTRELGCRRRPQSVCDFAPSAA